MKVSEDTNKQQLRCRKVLEDSGEMRNRNIGMKESFCDRAVLENEKNKTNRSKKKCTYLPLTEQNKCFQALSLEKQSCSTVLWKSLKYLYHLVPLVL